MPVLNRSRSPPSASHLGTPLELWGAGEGRGGGFPGVGGSVWLRAASSTGGTNGDLGTFQRSGRSAYGAGGAEGLPSLLEGPEALRCGRSPRQNCGFGQLLGVSVPSEKWPFGEENVCVICQKAVRERAKRMGMTCPGERDEEQQGPGAESCPGWRCRGLGLKWGTVPGRMAAPAPGLGTLPCALLRSPPSSSGSRGPGQTLPPAPYALPTDGSAFLVKLRE